MKTLINSLLLVLLFSSLNSQLFSQGTYLERGKNGFEVGAQFSSNENSQGIFGKLGYSVDGILDFGILAGNVSLTEKLLGYDIGAKVISPYVSFHIFKPDSTIPIGVSICGDYKLDTYYSDILSQNQLEMNGSYYSIGLKLYSNIKLSNVNKSKIQPYASIYHTTGKWELKDTYNHDTISEDNDYTSYGIGINLSFQIGNKTIFHIGPGLNFTKDTNSFGINTGFIF